MSKTKFSNDVDERLSSVLLDSGFSGGDLRWVRVRDQFIDCVDIQIRSDDAACCVNLGEHLSFLPVVGGSAPIDLGRMSSVDCEIRARLAPDGEPDYWWGFGSGFSDVEDLVGCFKESGEAFFRKYRDFPKPFADVEMSNIGSEPTIELMPMMTKIRRILLIARMYDYLNDVVKAVEWADFGKQNAGMAVGPKSAFREILRKYN